MAFDTPKWNENNEKLSTQEIAEENIKAAKEFAKLVYLDDLQKDEFNLLKVVLDEISAENWQIAFANIQQKLNILYNFKKKLDSENTWDFTTKSNINTAVDNLERWYNYEKEQN